MQCMHISQRKKQLRIGIGGAAVAGGTGAYLATRGDLNRGMGYSLIGVGVIGLVVGGAAQKADLTASIGIGLALDAVLINLPKRARTSMHSGLLNSPPWREKVNLSRDCHSVIRSDTTSIFAIPEQTESD